MLITSSDVIKFIESAFGPTRVSRDHLNVSIRCPRPECKSHGDPTKFKLAIRVTDRAAHCWVCGWRARSLLPLLMRFSTSDKLAEYKEKFYSGPLFNAPVEQEREKLVLPRGFRLIATSSDRLALRARKYVERRGLTERDMWRRRLGVADDVNWDARLIIPSFDAAGELNFYTGRAIAPGMVKYNNSACERSSVIFGEVDVDWTQRVILCEGPFDSFTCGENAIPLLGCELSEESATMEQILLHKTPVALTLDADMPQKMQRFGKLLTEYGIDVVLVDLAGSADPGSMSRKDFRAQLDKALPWSWERSFRARLTAATASSSSYSLR